jgi:hypothetical protein
MAKNLSIKEVEDFVFSNKIIQSKLEKYKFLFQTYNMALSVPFLHNLKTRTVLEFIDLLDQEDIKIISDTLKKEVQITKPKFSKVKNFNCYIDNLEFLLDDASNYTEVCLSRKGNNIKVLLWR